MTSNTTSVSEAPIWNPTLPPSTCMAAGALQPEPPCLRHTAKPRPNFAPKMNPAFFMPGTTTMQRLVEQILGDTFVGSLHHVGQRVSRGVQPVIDLDFSVCRKRDRGNRAGDRQNGYQCLARIQFLLIPVARGLYGAPSSDPNPVVRTRDTKSSERKIFPTMCPKAE